MSGPPTARMLAVRVLRDIGQRRGFSNRALSEHLERFPSMDPRDRGLCTTLVYGVLRHQLRLDEHVDRHAHRPKGLKGALREILRVAAYEMRELKRPGSIAVSEALRSLAVFDRGGRMRGVVQAVLSGVDREGDAVDAQLESGSPLDVLHRRWSIPRWIAGRWIKHLGPHQALTRAQKIATPPPVDLRLDPRADLDEVLARMEREHPGARIEVPSPELWPGTRALRVRGGGDLFYGALHSEGRISVQGLAAQQAAIRLGPCPGERVLDACAGMGVKTLQLAEMMDRRGTILAVDQDPRQLEALPELQRRGQLDNPALQLHAIVSDLSQADPRLDEYPFDRVLLDAPCTGLGNLSRHPEIRNYRNYEDIELRARLQRTLLQRNLPRLRRGGVFVYAVCSAEPEEGPDVVRNIAHEQGYDIQESRTFTPEGDDTEGFYVAVLRHNSHGYRSGHSPSRS